MAILEKRLIKNAGKKDGSIKIAKPRSGTASTTDGTEGVSKKPLFTCNPANLSAAHLRASTSVPKSGLASNILLW